MIVLTAGLIAREAESASSDEAFLADLMHVIEFMIALQHDRYQYARAVSEVDVDEQGAPMASLLPTEHCILGVDHQALGAALCVAWKFPKNIVDAAVHHHGLSVLSGSQLIP